MQTRCPKCTTIVKANATDWAIINGACPELSGTEWENKPEFLPRFRTSFSLKSYCPVLPAVPQFSKKSSKLGS
jgi:hypothetical protein